MTCPINRERTNACPCGRETWGTADSQDIGSSFIVGATPRRSLRSVFSSARLSVLFLNSSLSFLNSSFCSSSNLIISSNSFILAFFLSLAVCAATLFFNFLLSILSSGVRWVSRFRFLGNPLSVSIFSNNEILPELRLSDCRGTVVITIVFCIDVDII